MQTVGALVALVAIGLGACSKSGSSSVSAVSAVVTASPNPAATAVPTACANGVAGVAYVPDGGGGSFNGIQVVHFVDPNLNLCAVAAVQNVPFAGPVGPFVSSVDGSVALAAISNTGAATFTRIQDVFGIFGASITPVGATYDITAVPTPAPSTTPTAVPSPFPVLADANSIAVVGGGTSAIGLVAGVGVGVLGLTSLTNAPPQFGGFIPFQGSTPAVPSANRPGISIASDGSSALLRGPNDLLAYSIKLVSVGYQFQVTAVDSTLGWGLGKNLRGFAAMGYSPADGTRALIAQAPGANDVTLLTSLPAAIKQQSKITLPSRPHSVVIALGGAIAVVGADNGFYVLSGVDTGSLALVTAFAPNPADTKANAPSFVGCNGTFRMTNVSSVDLTSDQRFLVVVGSPPGQVCPGGNNSSLIVLPFNTGTGAQPSPTPVPVAVSTPVPTAAPTMVTVNGIVTRPADTDYVIVR